MTHENLWIISHMSLQPVACTLCGKMSMPDDHPKSHYYDVFATNDEHRGG
jgi:hypothetical protein